MRIPIDKQSIIAAIKWLPSQYHRYRYQKTIRRLREDLLLFGHDLSNLTDKEIEDGVREAGRAIANSGVTVDEAAASMRDVAKLLHNVVEGDMHGNTD